MSKHRVAVLKVVTKQSSVTAAAAEYGFGRQHLQRLLRRYRAGGREAVEPRSRRPRTDPGRTPEAVRDRILDLRTELGLFAGVRPLVGGDVKLHHAIADPPAILKRRTAAALRSFLGRG